MLESIQLVGAIASSVLTLLGGAIATGFFEKIVGAFIKKKLAKEAAEEEAARRAAEFALHCDIDRFKPATIAQYQIITRLKEGRAFKDKWERYATGYRWSGHFLTFGQYVIGGVLASSFVQQSLSPQIVGFFGVLVLLASLIKQQYHPEVSAQRAAQKAAQAKIMIRDAEDSLAILQSSEDFPYNPAPLVELLKRISAVLNAIESVDMAVAHKQLEKPKPESRRKTTTSGSAETP
jgi:hypothetical protein